ncbi:tRNA (adenosine(37)-N6)-threonylcarbamoyltransferase complex ATPase subunit type 1 TsaE [Spirochaetia bacterium 38H-sp]|uniref:tRNA threonylcarbamoyladenosine biosynthesis protein TsaE n=1 Tax=Rarispira pelagica TaxID=3141764 RepID=A0ABU9UD16_9SPIR
MSSSPEESITIARNIAKYITPPRVIAYRGGLGAGKTTFTRGLLSGWGASDIIQSPTFTIIKEYFVGFPVYHIDAYRLSSAEELEFIGIEDIFYGDGIAIIEWSEKVEDILPDDRIDIFFNIPDDFKREIIIEGLVIDENLGD